MLEKIKSPLDIKRLSYNELDMLAAEIRGEIINAVSENGGHLASNLGIVETTLAIHRVFSAPDDKILFDVSHQCYAHKLITGRYDRFHTLRTYGGISGFTDKNESEYDTVTAGHSGSSISAALGIAAANKFRGSDAYTIAVAGDGAFTNGMIYEAINNCDDIAGLHLIIILNDNEMSISKNVGGVSHYLSRVRTSRGYLSFKHSFESFLNKIPVIGRGLAAFTRWCKNAVKSIFIKETLFENFGIPYIGPVDGNDTEKLEIVLSEAKRRGTCSLVHVITKKGKGYMNAELEPEKYHSTGKLCVCGCGGQSFTAHFGEYMCRAAEDDDKICAITVAMKDGTGLGGFNALYPDRFFDVGIAEEHAVAFAGGLAIAGMKPVCAVYSTFSQRAFDQIFHDAALQRAPIVLALDHSGIVPDDGVTHQGIFDAALFSMIPGVEIYSPETYTELDATMDKAVASPEVSIVRYPKGAEHEYDRNAYKIKDGLTYSLPDAGVPDIIIITYGIITEEADAAAKILRERYGVGVGVIKLIKIFPLDMDMILDIVGGTRNIYILEEGILSGGIAEKLAGGFAARGYDGKIRLRAVDAEFIPHGNRAALLQRLGFTREQIADEISSFIGLAK